jgi:hypothetical protein
MVMRVIVINGISFLGVIIIVVLLIGCVGAVRSVRYFIQPDRNESVLLEPDRMTYDPGQAFRIVNWGEPSAVSGAFSSHAGIWQRVGTRLDVPRDEIALFAIDTVDGGDNLYFYWRHRRVDIAEVLNRSEKEWLLEVLRQWLTGVLFVESPQKGLPDEPADSTPQCDSHRGSDGFV